MPAGSAGEAVLTSLRYTSELGVPYRGLSASRLPSPVAARLVSSRGTAHRVVDGDVAGVALMCRSGRWFVGRLRAPSGARPASPVPPRSDPQPRRPRRRGAPPPSPHSRWRRANVTADPVALTHAGAGSGLTPPRTLTHTHAAPGHALTAPEPTPTPTATTPALTTHPTTAARMSFPLLSYVSTRRAHRRKPHLKSGSDGRGGRP